MSELDDLRAEVERLKQLMSPPTMPAVEVRRERPQGTPSPQTPPADPEFEQCKAARRHRVLPRRWPLPEQPPNGATIPYDNPLCQHCGATIVYHKPLGTTDAMILEKLRRAGVELVVPTVGPHGLPVEAKKKLA